MVKTLPFQCRGHGFDPWAGKFCMLCGVASEYKKIKQGLAAFLLTKVNNLGHVAIVYDASLQFCCCRV